MSLYSGGQACRRGDGGRGADGGPACWRRSGGQAAILLDLQANTPAISNASHYAKIVEEHALLRRMITVSNEIAETAYGMSPKTCPKRSTMPKRMMFDVAQRRVTNTTAPIRDLLPANLDRIEMLYDRGEAITGLSTGYLDLDEKLAGLQPNALYVVGARPAMGKTAFALGMAANSAMKDRRPVLIFNLGDEPAGACRSVCFVLKPSSIRAGSRPVASTSSEWNRISHAVGRLAETPIYIDDNPRHVDHGHPGQGPATEKS